MSIPLRPSDPCYWMLEQGRADPSKRSTTTVFDARCYICRDPEFALMGLPLCFPCDKCGGHIVDGHGGWMGGGGASQRRGIEMANETQEQHPMMKCGHAAQGQSKDGKWACIICVGIDPGATTINEAPPSFAGRTAICSYSHKARAPYTQVKEPVPSGPHLAFFEHKPNEPHDRYYCGCFGWD